MSRTATRVSILGIFLIAFGALLLLRKFDVIDLQVREVIWPSLALFGLIVAGRGLFDGVKWKVFWGTVLFLYSIFFFVRSLDRYDIPFQMVFPATFLVFGVVFVMLFVNRPAEWYFLVPALLLLGVGASMMLTEYGYWYGWELRDAISRWWPLALVLMGAGMLLRRKTPATPGTPSPGWPHDDASGRSADHGVHPPA